MPATAAQVFGPTTVDPGFTTTGEKTLLTMSTTLPAGGKNVVIVSFVKNAALATGAQGAFRIYKGTTLLYETPITQYFNYTNILAKHVLLIAVDTSPAGNDTYHFKINITTAGTVTGSVHVQGIVVKTDDAVWRYNTTSVNVAGGATAIITSMATSFPANSKIAIVAVVYGSIGTTGNYLIGAGNVKLKSNTNVLSSNEFNIGAYSPYTPFWVSLTYLDTPASSSQTYSVEVTNGSTVTYSCYAEIVAFTVATGAFLDTGSVALTSGSQVTVGNLSTTLSGNVVVIGLAAAENTTSSAVTAFNAGDVVLQKDNSATNQIGNLVSLYLGGTSAGDRSGITPLFRVDSDVSNPSYQVKMTAEASGINGEAKILAFALVVVSYVTVSDSAAFTDAAAVSSSVVVSDSFTGSDSLRAEGHVNIQDQASFTESVVSPRQVSVSDQAAFTDTVKPLELGPIGDSASFTDRVGLEGHVSVQDVASFTDYASRILPVREVSDQVTFTDVAKVRKTLYRQEHARRLKAAKRILERERVEGHRRLGPE
jgi:hypothetical protein